MATPSTLSLLRHGYPLALPPHDYEVFTYVGSTNNVSTIVGKLGGSSGLTVGTLTFTYVSAGAANDDNVASITLTVP